MFLRAFQNKKKYTLYFVITLCWFYSVIYKWQVNTQLKQSKVTIAILKHVFYGCLNIETYYTFLQQAEFDWNSKLQGRIYGLFLKSFISIVKQLVLRYRSSFLAFAL